MSIDDERVRFYFRNRVQIEEWAALRTEAAAAVDDWMEQLGPDCTELAQSLGPDVRLRANVGKDQAYPSFRLRHVAWAINDDDDLACVALEWARNQTTMRKGYMPYVGVRSPKAHTIGIALRNSEEIRLARLTRKDLHSAASAWWPAYSYVMPPGDFPLSVDAYRESLLDALRLAWAAYEPIVTNVLAAVAASGAPATPVPVSASE